MQGCMSNMLNLHVELSEGLQQLKNEHPPLLFMLDELLYKCQHIENNEESREQLFKDLNEKVVVFHQNLEPHSEREEGVLFKMMEKYIGRETGPLAVMEYEHDQAKGFINTFLQATKERDSFKSEEMLQFSELIKNAYYILIDHFSKEEKVLFPMAEQMLTSEEKQELKEKVCV